MASPPEHLPGHCSSKWGPVGVTDVSYTQVSLPPHATSGCQESPLRPSSASRCSPQKGRARRAERLKCRRLLTTTP